MSRVLLMLCVPLLCLPAACGEETAGGTDRLDVVVPSLVEAMFTNFPGRNGETVRITIPSRPRS